MIYADSPCLLLWSSSDKRGMQFEVITTTAVRAILEKNSENDEPSSSGKILLIWNSLGKWLALP
jgi:hypothetical protein